MYRFYACSKRDIMFTYITKYANIELSSLRSDSLKAHICNKKKYFQGFKSLQDMYRLYSNMDIEIKNKIQLHNVETVCYHGCCECCKEYFTVAKLEYFVIRHYLISHDKDFSMDIEKSKRIVKLFKEKYPDKYKILEDKSEISIHMAYSDFDIREFENCPFLKDGKCSIYPVRPIICRLYGTSYNYNTCEKVMNKCKSSITGEVLESEVLKHMIYMPSLNSYLMGIDYSSDGNNIQKPLPLFWWMAHDKDYEDEYNKYVGK